MEEFEQWLEIENQFVVGLVFWGKSMVPVSP